MAIFKRKFEQDFPQAEHQDFARAVLEQNLRQTEDDIDFVNARMKKAREEIAGFEHELMLLDLQRKNLEKALEKFE